MLTATNSAPAGTTVEDIMQRTVVTIAPETTVRELAQILSREGLSGAPVIDWSGKIRGVVSATDVLRLAAREAEIPAGRPTRAPALLPEEEDGAPGYCYAPESGLSFDEDAAGVSVETSFDTYRVEDIMTPVAFTASPSDSLPDLVNLLLRGRIHRAPVVDRGVLLGIVTPFDVLRSVFGNGA